MLRSSTYMSCRAAKLTVLALVLGGTAVAAKPERVGRAIVTFYWTIDESRYHGKPTTLLRDGAGHVIASTTKRFKRDLVKQGTGVLRDGRTVYFLRRIDGESRFRVTGERWGIGSTGCPLIPYRTVAVDPRFVKLGTTIYIPQLKGAKLPDGTVHDGLFIASDRGRFRGAHIDFFAGAGPRGARPFIRKGYGSRSHVTVYLVGTAGGCAPLSAP
jgi:3D (Asp-Asp-Asp) domain-containing protein